MWLSLSLFLCVCVCGCRRAYWPVDMYVRDMHLPSPSNSHPLTRLHTTSICRWFLYLSYPSFSALVLNNLTGVGKEPPTKSKKKKKGSQRKTPQEKRRIFLLFAVNGVDLGQSVQDIFQIPAWSGRGLGLIGGWTMVDLA